MSRSTALVVTIKLNQEKALERKQKQAQLSQSDHATLRVIEYFAKSLKIIQNDTVA